MWSRHCTCGSQRLRRDGRGYAWSQRNPGAQPALESYGFLSIHVADAWLACLHCRMASTIDGWKCSYSLSLLSLSEPKLESDAGQDSYRKWNVMGMGTGVGVEIN